METIEQLREVGSMLGAMIRQAEQAMRALPDGLVKAQIKARIDALNADLRANDAKVEAMKRPTFDLEMHSKRVVEIASFIKIDANEILGQIEKKNGPGRQPIMDALTSSLDAAAQSLAEAAILHQAAMKVQ